jgi:hypothetical protein
VIESVSGKDKTFAISADLGYVRSEEEPQSPKDGLLWFRKSDGSIRIRSGGEWDRLIPAKELERVYKALEGYMRRLTAYSAYRDLPGDAEQGDMAILASGLSESEFYSAIDRSFSETEAALITDEYTQDAAVRKAYKKIGIMYYFPSAGRVVEIDSGRNLSDYLPMRYEIIEQAIDDAGTASTRVIGRWVPTWLDDRYDGIALDQSSANETKDIKFPDEPSKPSDYDTNSASKAAYDAEYMRYSLAKDRYERMISAGIPYSLIRDIVASR